MARKGADEDLQRDEVLRAVIIAESFGSRFAPISFELPEVLMPLANTPMLEYTIESLSTAGVKEIIVFCVSHAEKIKSYLDNSRWCKPSSPVKVVTKINSDCVSFGAALRDVYEESMTSDFVLVHGDLVSNIALEPALAAHRARREQSCMMTSLFRQLAPGHPTRSPDDAVFVALDPESAELLHIERPTGGQYADLPIGLLSGRRAVALRSDLVDCHIDICSPDVLTIFTDDFDLDTRADFMRHILSGEEITGVAHRLFAHVVRSEYAARAQCLHTYAAVSKDIIHRWPFPLVVDSNFAGASHYRAQRNNLLKDRDVRISQSSRIGKDTVLGAGTVVADGATVTDCVIGAGCTVGAGAVLRGAFLWPGVVIEAGATVVGSIVCNRARVCARATVGPNCIVSFGAVVGAGMTLPEHARLSLVTADTSAADDGWDDEAGSVASVETGAAAAAAGGGGVEGFAAWEAANATAGGSGFRIAPGAVRSSLVLTRSLGLAGECDGSDSASSVAGDEDDEDCEVVDRFEIEVAETIARAAADRNYPMDTLTVEMSALKLTYDRQPGDCVNALVPAVVSLIDAGLERDALVKSATAVLAKWSEVIQRFMESDADMSEVMDSLLQHCVEQAAARKLFLLVLQLMWQNKLLSGPRILEWVPAALADDERDAADLPAVQALLQGAQVVKFLGVLEDEADGSYEDDSDE